MRRLFLAVLTLAPLSIAACCPTAESALSAEEEAAIAAEVERTIVSYFEAARDLDMERGLPVWANVEWFVLAADGALIDDYDAFVRELGMAWSTVDGFLEMETWNPHTRVLGRNAASSVLEYRWTVVDAQGDTVRSHGSWMYVLERFEDGWKIVHSAGTHLYDGADPGSPRPGS